MSENKITLKQRLENLIKSNQSVHLVCQSDFSKYNQCNLVHFYENFKCGYKSGDYCTYNKFLRGSKK